MHNLQMVMLARGGPTFHTKGHIGKNFKAGDRTDWKSKKKLNTSSVVLFFTKNQVKSKKRSSRPQMSHIPLNISEE